MSESKEERIFLDITRESAQNSGLFVRNDLKDIIERVEKDETTRVIGIIYDGTYNLEILTEKIKENE
jgi:hypothetical protein|tara:strand:- start:5272 stop:5472 length:201 start_codon:yes stop_codon:yes gene_type:complete